MRIADDINCHFALALFVFKSTLPLHKVEDDAVQSSEYMFIVRSRTSRAFAGFCMDNAKRVNTWGLTFELTGPLRQTGIWARLL